MTFRKNPLLIFHWILLAFTVISMRTSKFILCPWRYINSFKNLNRPRSVLEFEAHRFHDNRHMKTISLPAVVPAAFITQEIFLVHISLYTFGLCNFFWSVGWYSLFQRWGALTLTPFTRLDVPFPCTLPFWLLVQRTLLCLYLRRICPSTNCPWRIADSPAWSFDQTLLYTLSSTNCHCTNFVKILWTRTKSLLVTKHDTLFSEKLPLYSLRKQIEFKI
jgi:hypothetical protein